MNKLKIKVAPNAGFCFGVKRAIDLVEKILENSQGPVFCWGELIHNPIMMNRLKKKGLKVIDDLKDFKINSIFVIRSHGITLEDLNLIKNKTNQIVDTTCPFVKKAQNWAKKFNEQGLKVVIIGDKNHIEVKGINSRADNQAFIIDSALELENIKEKLSEKVGIVCQTTQKSSKLMKIIQKLKELKIDFELQDTICLDSTQKQKEVKEICDEPDLLIVIGGLNSSNTTKLAEIGKSKKIKTYHIEKAEDILQKWFLKEDTVFLTAGASTPPDEVIKAKKIMENFDF